jgi:hypothetical protein
MTSYPRNVAGQTKKSVAVSLNFIAWSVGNAVGKISQPSLHPTTQTNSPPLGPQVFRSNNAPRYFIAFSTHMGCYVLLLLVIIFLRFYLTRLNKQRDAAAAAGVREADDKRNIHAFEDLTDKENPNFRYVF